MPIPTPRSSSKYHGSDLISPSVCAAIRSGLFSQVRYLLELDHSPVFVDSDGRSPLSLCSLIEDEKWAVSLSRLLLEKGASVGQTDKSGLNALHYACIYAREALIPILLGAIDFDLNVGDRHGNSALFYAATSGSIPVLTFLINALKRFELTLDRPNRLGVTPLMQAWRADHLEAGNLLLKEGADPMRTDSAGRSCRSYEAGARKTSERRQSAEEARKMLTSLRLDDSIGWRRWRSLRARSAPNGIRHSWHDLLREQKLDECRAQRRNSQLIHNASVLDARNDPQRVFETDPVDFFDRRLRSGGSQHLPRPLTAHHNRRQPPVPLKSSSQPHLSNRPENGEINTWRGEVAKLYNQYECQCSGSYRDTARPPSPSASIITNYNGLDAHLGKDYIGLSVEAINDLSSVNSRSSRRGSVMSQRSFTSTRDIARKLNKNRKGSGTRQSMESVIEDDDLQVLSQVGTSQRIRKRLSIDTVSRTLPRAVSRPPKLPE